MKDYKLKQRNLRASHTLGWHKNGIATILLQEFYTRQHKFARSVGASVSEKVGMD
jgi:hypothetical protein